ncbi:MAG: hypothetical protein A2857_01235 [Candidatus Levybacteria bacterium RIFCSPHIGHO2_01_FULL_36_15]|nr:MAG: hypothetical protein A2857_01235 [Candidatus Levybacteria bacterium RIFCSPHIGHO2_01_FULL_36_15]
MKSHPLSNVTVLIPAVNEEKTIEKMVKDCIKIKKYNINILVIIDSKTTDQTRKIAEKSGAKVVHVGKGMGKGNAVKLSIPHIKGDYVVQIDADYQFIPSEIPRLIDPLTKGHDVTLGTRYQKGSSVEPGSVSFLKLLGSFFLSGATSAVTKQRITDVMAGFKGFKTPVLKEIKPEENHFGYEAELVIKAVKKKYKVLNVPITYKKRSSGSSNVNSIKHGILVLITILKTGLKN